jgi:hypothetical protein
VLIDGRRRARAGLVPHPLGLASRVRSATPGVRSARSFVWLTLSPFSGEGDRERKTDAFIGGNGLLDVVKVSPSQIIEELPRPAQSAGDTAWTESALAQRARLPQVIALPTGNEIRLAVEADKLDWNEIVPFVVKANELPKTGQQRDPS